MLIGRTSFRASPRNLATGSLLSKRSTNLASVFSRCDGNERARGIVHRLRVWKSLRQLRFKQHHVGPLPVPLHVLSRTPPEKSYSDLIAAEARLERGLLVLFSRIPVAAQLGAYVPEFCF